MTEEVTGTPEGGNPEAEQEENTTLLEGGEEGEAKEVAPDWPDDWRTKLAGDDEKLAKRLQRFQSPKDITKAWLSADQKIASGEYKSDLPDDASDEQIAAYRKERGIPETPDGYFENLPDGVVIGEEDKEMAQAYVERVHGRHADPAVVAESLAWYQDLKEQQIAAQVENDRAVRQKYEDELRAEWGGEYRANINSLNAFLDAAPTADDGTPMKDLVLGSRLSDGTPMGNHPAFLRWMAQMANEANPAGFVSPGSGGSQAESVADELSEIRNVMRTNRARYNKDTKMQERYRALLDAQSKLAS